MPYFFEFLSGGLIKLEENVLALKCIKIFIYLEAICTECPKKISCMPIWLWCFIK